MRTQMTWWCYRLLQSSSTTTTKTRSYSTLWYSWNYTIFTM